MPKDATPPDFLQYPKRPGQKPEPKPQSKPDCDLLRSDAPKPYSGVIGSGWSKNLR